MTKKKHGSGLGRSLIKQKPTSRLYDASALHTTELNDGYDWGRANVASITEQNDLEEFLATAELAGTDFTAEKQNVTVVSMGGGVVHGVLSEQERASLRDLHEMHRDLLRIPRRPPWDESTSAEELHASEKESFVAWRRQLAELQETDGLMMTPYEKNLEFWRQLWRVIERSDVVVQIVDARNPLLFLCQDLVRYVAETGGGDKRSLLLLNKADLLTPSQRDMWSCYLDSVGIQAVFFSALLESKKGEQEAKDADADAEEEELQEDGAVAEAPHQHQCAESLPGGAGALFSAEELLHLFRTVHPESKERNGKTVIGLVGYPNVGKSSTINALLRSKRVSVSTTPGKTKHFQTLNLDEELCLCDCPGLVFPNFVSSKAEMVVHGILPIDQMTDHVGPVNLVGSLIPRHVLESTYSICLPAPHETEDPTRAPTSEELLNSYGYMRGFMTQSGLPDNPRASRYILKDFVSGKLLYCVAPPGVSQEDYHTFPPPPARVRRPLLTFDEPPRMRRMQEQRTTSRDIDRGFFRKAAPQAHVKGRIGPGTVAAPPHTVDGLPMDDTKPWKKHHNGRKKEKLRRVYAEHDV
uniref:Large subunit GTPase 1 homolog n=1 Tax=Amblyomma aureolatum TaxID=187763 RepID=A0A1E1XFH0_9ACAR